MIPNRTDIFSILIAGASLALSPPAQAQAPAADSGWSVSKNKSGAPELKRTIGVLSVLYRARSGDADFLRVRVKPCDDDAEGWLEDDDVVPEGASAIEKRDSIRDAIIGTLQTAGLTCALPDGDEDKIMDGFDAAYDQFKAQRK